MHIIDGANQKVQVVTSAASAVKVSVSYAENNAGTITPGDTITASITTAATTDVLAAAGASKQRAITAASARNDHASTTNDVTIQVTDGTNTTPWGKATLLAGETLVIDELGVPHHYDSNMGEYPAVGNIAVQADMEAATSTTLAVTPGMVKYHPGVAKFWGLFSVSGTTVAGYNVDAPTDNGTGDITVNITTDMSSASWCAAVSVEMTASTYAVANARTAHVRLAGQAAGTLRCDCIDGTAITQLVKDPTQWHITGFGDQ